MREMESSRPPRTGLLLLGALAVVVAGFSNSLAGPFLWDDRPLILEQAVIHDLGSPSRHFTEAFWAKSPSSQADDAYYRPIVTLSYALNWALSGPDPVAFHATNVILHLVVCALLFVVAIRLGASPPAAGAAAAVVGVLPRLTECVTWVSGRTDVLAAAFALGALAVHESRPDAHVRRAVAALLLLLGLLSKEVALAALVAITVLEVAHVSGGPDRTRRAIRNLLPAAVVLLVYGAMRTLALAGIHSQGKWASLDLAFPRAIQALGAYLSMLLDPLRPRLQIGLATAFSPAYLALGLVAILLVLLALRRGIRARWPAGVWAGAAIALTSLGLVLHVVPIRVNTLAADRFLYFPALGLGLAFAVGGRSLGRRAGQLALAAVVIALPALGMATFMRNDDWADELRLWRVAVGNSPPENVLPRIELGNALFRRGLFEEARREWEGAIPFSEPYLRANIVGDLAAVYSELGRYDDARELAQALLASEPTLPLHHYNLGIIEARALRFETAEKELRRALELLPEYPAAERALVMVQEVRREAARLPSEAEGEPPSVQVTRAALDQRLGRRLEAERRWMRLLESGSTTTEQTWDGVRFLLARGTPDGARYALRKLEAGRMVGAGELEELRLERARREKYGLLAEEQDIGPGAM